MAGLTWVRAVLVAQHHALAVRFKRIITGLLCAAACTKAGLFLVHCPGLWEWFHKDSCLGTVCALVTVCAECAL